MRAINVPLGKIQHLSILILASGHDARDNIGHIHVILDARQILSLADLDVGVAAHALHDEGVEPVSLQLSAVLLDDAIAAQQAVHGILVLEGHFLGGGCQVGVEGKVMLRQAARRQALNH